MKDYTESAVAGTDISALQAAEALFEDAPQPELATSLAARFPDVREALEAMEGKGHFPVYSPARPD